MAISRAPLQRLGQQSHQLRLSSTRRSTASSRSTSAGSFRAPTRPWVSFLALRCKRTGWPQRLNSHAIRSWPTSTTNISHAILRTGEARIIGIGRELEAVRRDGSIFPIELAVSEVPGDGARYFTGIIRDISARKQAEEALRESQARIQAILDTAVDGILTIDERGVIESANPPLAACSATTRQNSSAATCRC